MSRLTNPATGAVVRIKGDLERMYRARGWVDADAPAPVVEATPEKPVVRARRARRSSGGSEQ